MSDERFENGYNEENGAAFTAGETGGENIFRMEDGMNRTGGEPFSRTVADAGQDRPAHTDYSQTRILEDSASADYSRAATAGDGASADYSRAATARDGASADYSRAAYSGDSASAAYSRASASTGTSYTGRTREYDNAGAGRRYYSYNSEEKEPVSPAKAGGKGREKAGLRAFLALVVILVFVLGAGAGAFISARATSSAAISGSPSTKGRSESDAKAEEDAPAAAEDKDDTSGTADQNNSGTSQGSTISRVEDDFEGTSLADTTVADVAEKVMPAIVSVYNKYTEESQFFGRTYTQEGEAAGSGIIIDETDGELLIVTNNHVVEGADSLSVQFINEENCQAALKGTDVSSDLAVIAVSLSDLPGDTMDQIAIADLGDSDSLRIGEHAIAIGNALGYGQSLTVGYISALNREMTSENGITGTFIQTDAAINPGNSGGALLNSRGQVIGINSNKIGGSSVEGMGFAIPISKAIPIIDSLKTQESKTKVAEEEQGVLGIYGLSVTSDVASAYGLTVGAYVEEIIEGSGAAESDLEEGDIITAIDGQTITGMEDLQKQLVYYTAGTEVTLTVQHPMEGRDYEERQIKVTLSRRGSLESSDNSGRSRQQGQQTWPSEDEDDSSFFGFPFGF